MREGKTCKQCNEFKELNDYYRNGKYYKSRCKECLKQNQKIYEKNNQEKIKDYNKRYYAQNQDTERTRRKKYYEEHKQEQINYTKDYRRKNGVQEKFLWTKEIYLEKLKEFVELNDNLSATYVCKYHHFLFKQSYTFFGGWKQALEYLGVNYDEVQIDFETAKAKGMEFERLLDDIINDLQIEFSKGFTKEVRPDYVFANNIWGDAKLSEWSIYHCDTVSKYEPYCNKLVIIFMRGNPERDEMITNKTRIISVFKIIKQLPKYKQNIFLKKIQEIEKAID